MKPPFRADMVGSLLRTEPLKGARAKREKGQITPAQLKTVEDEEIRKVEGDRVFSLREGARLVPNQDTVWAQVPAPR